MTVVLTVVLIVVLTVGLTVVLTWQYKGSGLLPRLVCLIRKHQNVHNILIMIYRLFTTPNTKLIPPGLTKSCWLRDKKFSSVVGRAAR